MDWLRHSREIKWLAQSYSELEEQGTEARYLGSQFPIVNTEAKDLIDSFMAKWWVLLIFI